MHRSNLHYTLKYPYKHHAWEEVKHRLRQITNIKDERCCNKKLADCLNNIYSILHWNSGHGDHTKVFNAITVYLNEYAHEEHRINFYVVVLPCLVRRAIDIQKLGNFKKLFKTDVKQKDTLSLSLTNSEQASILACRILCLFPCQNESNSRSLNLEYLYHSSRFRELNTIFSFFEQIASDPGGPNGYVTWLINSTKAKYDLIEWLTFDDRLIPITLYSSLNSIPNNSENVKVNIIDSYTEIMKYINRDNTELLASDLFIDTYDAATTINGTNQEVSCIQIDNLRSPIDDEILNKTLSILYKGLNQNWGQLGVKAKCRKLPDPIHPSTITNDYDFRISRIRIRPPQTDCGPNKRPLTCMETKQMSQVITSKRIRSRSLAEYRTKNSIFNKYDQSKKHFTNGKSRSGKTRIQRSASDCADPISCEPTLNSSFDRFSGNSSFSNQDRSTFCSPFGSSNKVVKPEVYDFVSKFVDLAFSKSYKKLASVGDNSNKGVGGGLCTRCCGGGGGAVGGDGVGAGSGDGVGEVGGDGGGSGAVGGGAVGDEVVEAGGGDGSAGSCNFSVAGNGCTICGRGEAGKNAVGCEAGVNGGEPGGIGRGDCVGGGGGRGVSEGGYSDLEAVCSSVQQHHPRPVATSTSLYKHLDLYSGTLSRGILKHAFRDLSRNCIQNTLSTSLCSMTSTPSRRTTSKMSRRLSLESDSLPLDFLSCSSSFPGCSPFDNACNKPQEYNTRRRASEPIKNMPALSNGYQKSKTSEHMRTKGQLEYIDNKESSVKVVIDWLISDQCIHNKQFQSKLDSFADNIAKEVMLESMKVLQKNIDKEKEKCFNYNRKHKIVESSKAKSRNTVYKDASCNRMLLGCGFFPDPAPFSSLVSFALDMAEQCLSSAIEQTLSIERYNSEMTRSWRPITYCCKDLSLLSDQYAVLLLWLTASRRNIEKFHIVIEDRKHRLIFRDVIEKYEDAGTGFLLKAIVNFMQHHSEDSSLDYNGGFNLGCGSVGCGGGGVGCGGGGGGVGCAGVGCNGGVGVGKLFKRVSLFQEILEYTI